MKIYCAGAENYINQIHRIREGFIELGHEITTPNVADIIYCNDPSVYSSNYREINPHAKIIYNVLDLPPHCIDPNKYDLSRYPFIDVPWQRNFDPRDLKERLLEADIITCICKEVEWQLKKWCKLDSYVIYNPIKEVSCLNLNEQEKLKNKQGVTYKYLYVGRANDPNKRFNLVYETMQKLNEPSSRLAVIGSENPGWGDYYGIVDDNILNLFYNSVDYFFFPSAFKSLGLPALESIVTKTIPIVANDDPTTKEFWEPIGVDINKIENYILNPDWNKYVQNFVNEKSEEYSRVFSKKEIAKNIINVYNNLNV
jgi:glycosyltransferase involved in cell wall biosynthesis